MPTNEEGAPMPTKKKKQPKKITVAGLAASAAPTPWSLDAETWAEANKPYITIKGKSLAEATEEYLANSQPKAAEEKPKEKKDPQANPRTRSSVFDNKFSASTEENWTKFQNEGSAEVMWVHKDELSSFYSEYRKCEITGKIDHRNNMHKVASSEEKDWDGMSFLMGISPEGLKMPQFKLKWTRCNQSGYFCLKSDTFKAMQPSKNMEMVEICKSYISEYRKCAVYGELAWTGNGAKVIKDSSKWVDCFISGRALQYSGFFKKCASCCKWFEKDHVKAHSDIGPHELCNGCASKQKNKNAIAAWNDKHFPSPIYTTGSRMGSTVNSKGLVLATMEKATVTPMRLFGAEAEVELNKPLCLKHDKTRFELAVAAKACLGSDFCSIKEDGSLTMNGKYSGDTKFDPDGTKNGPVYAGFEIVSAPCDLATHRERWMRLATCKELHTPKGDSLLLAWDTTTCGFHVHVSRAALNDLQVGRILRFVNHSGNAKFIQKIAGRGSDKYCRYIDKELCDARHPERVISPEEHEAYDRSRRVAVNLSNDKTVEFRIFRGTIHPNHIIRNLVFVDAVCDYCWPASRSVKDMDEYAKFIYFVSTNRKQYPELAAWFVKQKQLTLKKVGEGANLGKFTIQPDMVAEPDHDSVAYDITPKGTAKPAKAKKPKPPSDEDESF